jgi:methylated-DNA-[protein]-cysteine S-methyltransferase
MPTFEAKPLRMADAAVLRRLGVYQGSLKMVESAIRRLLSTSEQSCLMVTRQTEDGVGNGFIALIPDVFHEEIGRLSLYVKSLDLLPELLAMIARTAFAEHDFLRLETLVSAANNPALPIYEAFGFQTDFITSGSTYRTANMEDQLHMSLLKTRNRCPASGLVPYRLGLLSVTGTEDFIEQIDFHVAGEPVLNPYLKDLFQIWQLLDDEDCLLLSAERIEAIVQEPLPTMVQKAVDELKAYLSGEQSAFDLNLDLSCGSDFQRSVWAVLQKIPYGATVTYLDVAMQLTAGDLKKARALTRAVGSACGANPVPVVIPCHRVIGFDGRLTGFSGGLPNKEYLLTHEMFGTR